MSWVMTRDVSHCPSGIVRYSKPYLFDVEEFAKKLKEAYDEQMKGEEE